jgi:predicted acylesterase/phospholipase RssA
MGWFDWIWKPRNKQEEMLPDIKRAPVDPAFTSILQEYSKQVSKEKLALCLEGGGAKGRWQIGFAARMADIGLLPYIQVIAGTSVGGLNATAIGRYMKESPNLQACVDIWRGIRQNSDVYIGEIPKDIISIAKALVSGKLTGDSLLDISPLRNLVHKHFAGLTELTIPVFVIATDYITKSKVILGPGTPVVDMALATSAVPGAFPAHNGRYLDGGCVENCPYPYLLDAQKATKIIVLYCDPDPSKQPKTAEKPTTISTGAAAIASLFSVQSNMAFEVLELISEVRRLRGEDPVEIAHFYPSVPTGELLDFGGNTDLLQKGYDDAVKYLTPEKLRDFLLV